MALTTNIVGYWKLDEASGDAADSTASANTLTNTNSVGFASGIINNGADFSSSNTNKRLTKAVNLGIGSGAMSWSCWVNITTTPGLNAIYGAVCVLDTTTLVSYQVWYQDSAGTKRIAFNRSQTGVGDFLITENVTLTTGTWYHLVATYDGTNQRLYRNGSLVAGPTSSTGTGVDPQPSGTFIGSGFQAGTFLSGKVDEVGVWTRELTSAEVTQLYNGGVGLQYPFTASAAVPNFLGLLGVGS